MISLSFRPKPYTWRTVSFPSTLHLYPVLDVLLLEVPSRWQPDLRLGLQEALVNAVKHGNNLDPGKSILIRFAQIHDGWWWIISDQGAGFCPPSPCLEQNPGKEVPDGLEAFWPCEEGEECGRGLFLLYQIFDQVRWNAAGTELTLYKKKDRRYGFS